MKKIISLSLFIAFLLAVPLSVGQVPPPSTEAVLAMTRALLLLKDSKWQEADKAFDVVLMLTPKYAPAHMGKLCAELKVSEEALLPALDPPVSIDDNPHFKVALENADVAYKTQIQGYASTINARFVALSAFLGGTAPHIPKDDRKAGDHMVMTINGIEHAFRWCPPGVFLMGSPENEAGRQSNERQHGVGFAHGFWLLETEVTQGMWASVMGNNPSKFKGLQRPVESVSWDNCQEYITKLNDLGVAPAGFRFSLPTESQWEYACRAGTTTAYHLGNTINKDRVNFDRQETREVGSFPAVANAWGFLDMHGNVWEWCLDWYATEYPSGAVIDPIGAITGSSRVYRGGSWYGNSAENCRSAKRNHRSGSRDSDLGLRLALIHAE